VSTADGGRPEVLVYSGAELMGDALFKLPVFGALRQAFPGHRITWLAGQGKSVYRHSLRPLLDGLVDEVRDDAGIGASWREWVRPPPLAGRHFDVIIDTQRGLAVSLMLKRIAHRMFISAAAGFALSGRRPPHGSRMPTNVRDQILQLIRLAGGCDVALSPELRLPMEMRAAATTLLPNGPCYVGLAPGAGWREKCWPLDRFLALADQQVCQGRVPVFFIGPQEQEWMAVIRERLPAALLPEWHGRSDLPRGPLLALALAERLHAGVANDSGIGHILAAAGRPLITLFGPTDDTKWSEPSPRWVVIRARDFGGREMERIPYAIVADALDRLCTTATAA
jgi:ADP-heptose:LPS heptosyltransferase